METLITYIAMDRRQAMATGRELPDQTVGAALFADISGFTPLTEALLKEYGARRGPEELTRQLNLIYDALVTEVHRHGGSVMAFSGDAITCWLDGDDGTRATACGLAMQQAMSRFAALETPSGTKIALAMKVGIAGGPVRRYRVGDPQIQYIDALAGATLDQMAAAEHHAEKGDVIISPEIVAQIGHKLEFKAWRSDDDTNDRFGVVAQLLEAPQTPDQSTAWPPLDLEKLTEAQVRPWLLPPVYEQLRSGKGEFLAELRPAVAIFLSFDGIDYDQDETAGRKLDDYVRWVQNVLVKYEGYLFQLTIGDKGSYMYTAFGAPLAHEDDSIRAISAAWELRTPPASLSFIKNVKIGISQGRMRTGAYGGTMRRTYGVIGDEVNMAARLMQAANSGQVYVNYTARQTTGDTFIWDNPLTFNVKGKVEPAIVFPLNGLKARQSIHLHEPNYALPMVGRQAELMVVEQKLKQVLLGQGQIIGITAEAGMGKSRLVAEIISMAGNYQLTGYGGECVSYGTNTSYLPWQTIWRDFFEIDPSREAAALIEELKRQLNLIDPALIPRLPLLGAVIDLHIDDNDLTRSFDAKLRKTSLEAMLVDSVHARAQNAPLFFVLEDCHWLDPLSHDLLEVLARTIADLPVLLVMAYRPPQIERLQALRVSQLPNFTEIPLTDFTPAEAEELIKLKLNQFAGAQAEMSPEFIKRITTRAQGNPFYIEELLNYLQVQGIDPNDRYALQQLDLPDSLHSLILSRIDQLTEEQKTVLKVASVIGRLFQAAWVWGMYPELGPSDQVRGELEVLNHLELTPIDTPDPELAYLFKHVITQEVAYESITYATRAVLHDQLGRFIEQTYQDRLEHYIDLLAFHYGRSQNEPKKREYLLTAGKIAQAEYANEAAIDYYQQLLPLLPQNEKISIMLKLGEVRQLVGQWKEAGQLFREALDLANRLNDRSALAWCQTAMGEVLRKQGLYPEAATWFERAQTTFEELGDKAGVGQVLHYGGTLSAQQGDYVTSRQRYEESLAIRRELSDKANIASLLSNLGLDAHELGDYETAAKLYEESLDIRYQLGDKWAIAVSLNNMGYLAIDQGDYESAQTRLEVAVSFQREVGDRSMLADALNNLGNVARDQGDYEKARQLYREGLLINRELGKKWGVAYLLEDIGGLAARQGQTERALRLFGAAETLREEIGAPLPPGEQAKLDRVSGPVRQVLGEAAATAASSAGKGMSMEQAIEYALQEN